MEDEILNAIDHWFGADDRVKKSERSTGEHPNVRMQEMVIGQDKYLIVVKRVP